MTWLLITVFFYWTSNSVVTYWLEWFISCFYFLLLFTAWPTLSHHPVYIYYHGQWTIDDVLTSILFSGICISLQQLWAHNSFYCHYCHLVLATIQHSHGVLQFSLHVWSTPMYPGHLHTKTFFYLLIHLTYILIFAMVQHLWLANQLHILWKPALQQDQLSYHSLVAVLIVSIYHYA